MLYPRDPMRLPGGGAAMAVWLTFAVMLSILAILLAATWIVSH